MPRRLPFLRQGSEEPQVDSAATLVESPPEPQPDFSRRAAVFSMHDTGKLGLKVLLPQPTIPPPPLQGRRISVRQTGTHIPPVPPSHHPSTPPDITPVASFIPQLRVPLLPVIHLLLISTHLALAAAIPYMLVKHMIQPIVLWLILAVCLVLQAIYLVPGIILEVIGLFRRRPM